MKFIFYMLLIVNIAFYLWESSTQTVAEKQIEPPEANERIVLLKEIPGRLKPEIQDLKVLNGSRCYQLGPFASEPLGRSALEGLKPGIEKINLSFKSNDTVLGYWVLYPKAENLEAAKLNRKMLMDQGIRDVWLFDKGELQNSISLGFFDTKEAAEAMRFKLNEQKTTTEIKPRMLKSDGFWLLIDWSGQRSDLESLIDKLNHPTAQKLKPCD